MNLKPTVSIILPVYNGEALIEASINSVLEQSYNDFELIILDDGSTDGTWSMIQGYTDCRIKAFRHENIGLPATLNKGISIASGSYISRLDHDDLMLPHRLRKQVDFLNINKNVGLLGTWAKIYENLSATDRCHMHPTSSAAIKLSLLFDNPFVHSSVMIRRDVLDSVGVYTLDVNRLPPEDYELWSRIARKYEVGNIGEYLTVYREINSSLSRKSFNPFIEKVIKFSAENLYYYVSNHFDMKACHEVSNLYHGVKGANFNIDIARANRLIDIAARQILNSSGVDDEFARVLMNIKNRVSQRYISRRFFFRLKKLVNVSV